MSSAERRATSPGRVVVVAGAVLLLAACTASAPSTVSTTSAPSAADRVPSPTASSSRGEWGPDVAYLATPEEVFASGRVDGKFYAGSTHWKHLDDVDLFTVLESGLVYVAPVSRDIVWEGWQHQTRTIGHRPWVATGADLSTFPDSLVGNPDADLVTWVETAANNKRGDLVVVEGSSGKELARAPFTAEPGMPVLLASIDADHVWFATIPAHPVWEQDPVWHTWLWKWRDGEPRLRPGYDRLLDAAGEVLAVADGERLRFEDWEGHLLSTVPAWYWDGLPFGRALSPDGKVWLAGAAGRFVTTATGKGVVMNYPRADDPTAERFAWTRAGSTTFVHRDHGIWTCDGSSGACSDPAAVPEGELDSLPSMPRN